MSQNKNILHKNKLQAFTDWLDSNRIQYRPGKGQYQVMQVLTAHAGWQVIFDHEKEASIHYTVNEKLMKVVRQWLRETKRKDTAMEVMTDYVDALKSVDDYAPSERERALEHMLSQVLFHMNRVAGEEWVWDGTEQLMEEAQALVTDVSHFDDNYVYSKTAIAAAMQGLLLVINEDKDGTYFICGEAKEAIDYANLMLTTTSDLENPYEN